VGVLALLNATTRTGDGGLTGDGTDNGVTDLDIPAGCTADSTRNCATRNAAATAKNGPPPALVVAYPCEDNLGRDG